MKDFRDVGFAQFRGRPANFWAIERIVDIGTEKERAATLLLILGVVRVEVGV